MTLDEMVETVQLTYPQVYHACHTRHHRKRSTSHRLSARDAAILAHCSTSTVLVPAELARHLDIARSTLSEAIKNLTRLGYVQRVAGSHGDGRRSGIVLTIEGLRAVRETSVLETARLVEVLQCASPSDRVAITAGLTKLADACRRYRGRAPSNPRGGS